MTTLDHPVTDVLAAGVSPATSKAQVKAQGEHVVYAGLATLDDALVTSDRYYPGS